MSMSTYLVNDSSHLSLTIGDIRNPDLTVTFGCVAHLGRVEGNNHHAVIKPLPARTWTTCLSGVPGAITEEISTGFQLRDLVVFWLGYGGRGRVRSEQCDCCEE